MSEGRSNPRQRSPGAPIAPASGRPGIHGERPTTFALIAVLAAVWGMFFLKIPLLMAFSLALSAGGFYVLFLRTGTIDRIGALILGNFGLWVGSALTVGSVSVGDFLTPGYYPEEGRIFLYYLPMLFFSVVVARDRVMWRTVQTLSGVTVAVVALLLLWEAKPIAVLSIGANFVGLLTSHTGAGIYFGFLAVFLGLYGVECGRRRLIWLALLALLAVFASGSRESLVGICAVTGWYLLQRGNWRSLVAVSCSGVLFTVIMYLFTPHTFGKVQRMVDPNTVAAVVQTIQQANWQPGNERDFGDESGDINILRRMLYWSWAWKLFTYSPIVGVGFGRYNDFDVGGVGVKGLVYPMVVGGKNLTAGQPHNSYLQMLAETGIFGLVLLLSVWLALYRRLQRARAYFAHDRAKVGYFIASQGLIVFTLMDANFGHALGSPSLGIPVLTVIGVGLAVYRAATRQITSAVPVALGAPA